MATERNKRVTGMAESIAFVAIVAGVLVLANLGSCFVNHRFDFTEKRLFSLSHGSQRLVSGLHDDMEITAYFTDPLPPPFNATEQYVRDILEEYAAASHGHIHVRFVNPDNEDRQHAAEHDGVQKVQHQVIENDAVSAVDGYRGLVIRYLGDKKTIPVIEDTAGLEYRITSLIKELVGEKTKIGLVGGHGGPTLSEGLSGLRDALPTYDIREVQLTENIPQDVRALLIIAPETEFSDDELHRLDAYVMHGGALGVFGGTEKLNLQAQAPGEIESTGVDTHLNTLLGGWGVRTESNIVADVECGRAPLQTMLGAVLVPFPPVPIVHFDERQSQHPALFRLDQAIMPFTSSLTVTGRLRNSHDVTVRTLGRTTENSWLLTGDTIGLAPRAPREWTMEGRHGPFPVIVALEGRLPSAFAGSGAMSTGGSDQPQAGPTGPARAEHSTRVLVVGTAAFMRDEFLPRPDRGGQRDLTSALALALNSIDWLAQDSDLIAIRAKNVEDPALEVPEVTQAEAAVRAAVQNEDRDAAQHALDRRKEALARWDTKKAWYRWGNIVGIPLVIVLLGGLWWGYRRGKKGRLKLPEA